MVVVVVVVVVVVRWQTLLVHVSSVLDPGSRQTTPSATTTMVSITVFREALSLLH